jgi:hypothetical protein
MILNVQNGSAAIIATHNSSGIEAPHKLVSEVRLSRHEIGADPHDDVVSDLVQKYTNENS